MITIDILEFKTGRGWQFGTMRLTQSLGVDPEKVFDLTQAALSKHPEDAAFISNPSSDLSLTTDVEMQTHGPDQTGFQPADVKLTFICSNVLKTRRLTVVLDEKDLGVIRDPELAARQVHAFETRLRNEARAFGQRRRSWVKRQRAIGYPFNSKDYPLEVNEDGNPIGRKGKPLVIEAVAEVISPLGCWTHALIDNKKILPARLNGRTIDVAYVIANMSAERRTQILTNPSSRAVQGSPELLRINGVTFTAEERSLDFVGRVPRAEGHWIRES
jgi:hypothetical protein